jgi:diguanylate cyclase (GGDEF)-like protein
MSKLSALALGYTARMSKPTMMRLLQHIASLTGERQRPRLEGILVEAVRDLASAQRVAYFKLQFVADESLCWLAAETSVEGSCIHDDGVSVPETMVSLDMQPEILQALNGPAVTTFLPRQNGVRLLHHVAGAVSVAGFLEFDLAEAPSEHTLRLITALVTVFRNVMGLLDYSEVDTLTGLLNRKTFDEYLMRILASLAPSDDTQSGALHVPRRRRPHPAAHDHWLAVLDIDHFKRINDNFGHSIGDEVLLMVANMMKASFRSHDRLFRFGGEEFVVLLRPTSLEQAQRIFDRFRLAMESHSFPQVGLVTISTGYARIGNLDQPSRILDNADQALYWSKSHGRNQVFCYESLIASGQLQVQAAPESDLELF